MNLTSSLKSYEISKMKICFIDRRGRNVVVSLLRITKDREEDNDDYDDYDDYDDNDGDDDEDEDDDDD
ncbi:hypothetical protein M0802_000979 [Mischocyttarus mexicanus]|nr:hypothetical protein M0802_000979 [Mischocyttarus mexicanus]